MNPLKRYIPWFLALFFGVIYLLTPTALYYWDGVVFAYLCDYGTPAELIHPHHLLYNLIVDIGYEYVSLHFPEVSSLTFLIWISSIFGALTIYFSHMIFRTIFNREGLAVATSSFMGFSFTFWHFSTDANAYIISAFFPVLCAYLLVSADSAPKPKIRLLWTSIFFAIGMIIHQVVVLFYLVYAFWVIAVRFHNSRIKIRFIDRLIMLAIPGLIAASVYFLIGKFLFHFDSFHQYWEWITAYGRQERWWFLTQSDKILEFLGAVGISHLKLMFYPNYIRYGLFNFENLTMIDIAKKFVASVSLLTLLLVFIRGLVYLFGAIGRRRFYAALLILWILPYLIFFTFFTPQFEFYRLYYIFPLMVIFALGLKGFFEKPSYDDIDLPIYPNKLSGWVFVLLIIFALHNYGFGIRPNMKEENNPWLMDAKAFISNTADDAIMIVPFSDTEMEEYSRVANLVNYLGPQGILFAEPYTEFVGPVISFVGPIPYEESPPEPDKWSDIELKPGLFPDIENAYIHADMLDIRCDYWEVLSYRFPDNKIYLEGELHLPSKENVELVKIGTIQYIEGKRRFLVNH